ncbi:hypothetical protein QOT17_002682 [Balamuthia mandrillaris]
MPSACQSLLVGLLASVCLYVGFLVGVEVSKTCGEERLQEGRWALILALQDGRSRPKITRSNWREAPQKKKAELLKPKRLLWLCGLQAKVDGIFPPLLSLFSVIHLSQWFGFALFTLGYNHVCQEGTSRTSVDGSSDVHLRSYLVALQSARAKAPSVLPVVIVQGDWDGREVFINTVEQLGGVVLSHKLSFEEELQKHRFKHPQTNNLSCSFLKMDLPFIMEKIATLIDKETVDMNYVLWTDADVMFEKDLHANCIAKPRLFSLPPAAAFDGKPEDFGVTYINVSAYTFVFPEVIAYANSKTWHVTPPSADTLFKELFGNTSLISYLPNTFSYKVHWGRPQALFWSQPLAPSILHFQGPKPEFSVCAVHELRKVKKKEKTKELNHGNILGKCGGRSGDLELVLWGFERDGGEYWDEVGDEYRRYIKALTRLE